MIVSVKPLLEFAKVSLYHSQAPGRSRLVFANGDVMSVQPDGSVERRGNNADGPFEQCRLDGDFAVYDQYADWHRPDAAYLFSLRSS